MKTSLLCILAFAISFGAQAQTTGSFQQSIAFNEADYTFTRNLYYFVPTNYDSTQAYKLVVGFRGGPHSNAGQFRDQLTFLADSIGAIILCPENASHFNNQEGLTKQLFKYAVDTTMAMYNIDPDFIYLTGLSYGGRHATIVSMDTDNGPIPKLRGVIPFATGRNAENEPNYADIANFPPACMCIGLSDASVFINVANTIHNTIQANGGVSMLNEIPGVGHTVAFPTYPAEMMECFNFIESQYASTGIEDGLDQASISLFPNPASGHISISYPNEIQPTKMYVKDMTGRTVLNINSAQTQIDISKLSSGIHAMVIVTNKSTLTKRFMVLDE